MANATTWELIWTGVFALGTVFGLALLGFVTARLTRRYQQGRNGGGRLVAWKDVVLVGLLTLNAAIGLALGIVAVAAPATGTPATGPVERWALEWLARYAVPVLVAKGACVVAALGAVLFFELRLAHYFTQAGRKRALGGPPPSTVMAAEVATAAAENTEAVRENTEALRENTEAKEEKE